MTCTLPAAQVPGLAPAPGEQEGIGSLFPSGDLPTLYIDVSVPAGAAGEGTNVATVSGGGPLRSCDTDQVPFSTEPSPFGLVAGSFIAEVFDAAYPFGEPNRHASEHPFEFRTDFDVTAKTGVNNEPGDNTRFVISNGQIRTVEVTLPRGMIGNPEALPKCGLADFVEAGTVKSSTKCPANTQVGYLNASIVEGTHNFGRGNFSNVAGLINRVPLYNLNPPKGVPADFGFNATLVPGHIYSMLDPAQNYAITVVSPNISNLVTVRGVEVTVWGVPGDPATIASASLLLPMARSPRSAPPSEGRRFAPS